MKAKQRILIVLLVFVLAAGAAAFAPSLADSAPLLLR